MLSANAAKSQISPGHQQCDVVEIMVQNDRSIKVAVNMAGEAVHVRAALIQLEPQFCRTPHVPSLPSPAPIQTTVPSQFHNNQSSSVHLHTKSAIPIILSAG